MQTNVEFIIVGDGFASLFFAHQLIKNNHSFKIFSNKDLTSSRVAAGIINPVVLKRFTNFWMAKEQIDHLHLILNEMKDYLHKDFFIYDKIHRIFNDENESKTWVKKSRREDLGQFLDSDFHSFSKIKNPLETGSVSHSGRLDVSSFFDSFFKYFENRNSVIYEDFFYEKLDLQNKKYQDLGFEHIVFCEGYSVINNPFFKNLALYPNKGHSIQVELNDNLESNAIYKKKHFLFPLNHSKLYYYGGTYDRDNFCSQIDESAVSELISGLNEIVKDDYQVKDISFGFRPSVLDRRPLVGRHLIYDFMYLFNGLGSRGVLNASYFSAPLYNLIKFDYKIIDEIDLNRFK